MEQLVVRERLTLDVLVRLDQASDALLRDILLWGFRHDLKIDVERVEAHSQRAALRRHAVTVLGHPLTPTALAAVSEAIADTGGNIDRIVRLATTPVTAYDLVVIVEVPDAMRTALVAVAQQHGIDVAVQVNGLERLVVMDVDSTLIADEVIELLAEEAGCRAEVAAVTTAAMAGELDFETALRERVRRRRGDLGLPDGRGPGTAPTTWTCWPPRAWGSPSTPSRRSGPSPTPPSRCPGST